MKYIYTLILFAASATFSFSQNDTLLWEDFEAENIDYILDDFPNGDPNLYPDYLNFDVDGENDGSGADRPGEWFLSLGFADVDSTNTVLASNSWLQGEVDGAENWLILPRIHIQDNQANLYWKSAPFQLPRYMDGYQVLVSTETNIETDFTDTLAVFAEFNGALTTDIEDTATYVFTNGIMHTDLEYDSTDVTRHTGVLQQWSASLADYAGQDIFIAFRHRSDDDNLISIDDLLVLGTGSVGVEEVAELDELTVYPNPVQAGGAVTLEYALNRSSNVMVDVYALNGERLLTRKGHRQLTGSHRMNLDLTALASGNYLIALTINEKIVTKKILVTD